MNNTENKELKTTNREAIAQDELSEDRKKKMEEEAKFQRWKAIEKASMEAIAKDDMSEEMQKAIQHELKYTEMLTEELRKLLLNES